MIFSVFVGRYCQQKDTKRDQKKLNAMGLRGYVFFIDGFYTLKVATFVKEEKAKSLSGYLEKNGFDSFVK